MLLWMLVLFTDSLLLRLPQIPGCENPREPLPPPVLLRLHRLWAQPEDARPFLGWRRDVLREARPPALPEPSRGRHHPGCLFPVLDERGAQEAERECRPMEVFCQGSKQSCFSPNTIQLLKDICRNGGLWCKTARVTTTISAQNAMQGPLGKVLREGDGVPQGKWLFLFFKLV